MTVKAWKWSASDVARAAEIAREAEGVSDALARIEDALDRHVSRSHLDRLFSDAYGKTIAQLAEEGARQRRRAAKEPEKHDTETGFTPPSPEEIAAFQAASAHEPQAALKDRVPDFEDETTAQHVQAYAPVVGADEEEGDVADADEQEALLRKLMAIVKNRTVSLEELCDRIDISPRRAKALAELARGRGFSVAIDGPIIGRRPSQESREIHPIVEQAGEQRIFAVISDLHFGSKYHLRAQLVDFIHKAYARGVRTIICPGDIMDGIYRHGRWELTHHGFDEQSNEVAEGLPRLDGLQYHGIIGNHDETFEKESGLAVVQALQDVFDRHGRTDFHLYGARGAYVRLKAPGETRGLVVHIWHPLKGPAYALSYGMQKKVEGYAVGAKPDVLLTGHWHQSCFFESRGIRALSCGTFQGGGSAFGKSLGGAPSVGGWVIEYALTAGGTVRHFKPDWVAYYEAEEARDVGLG